MQKYGSSPDAPGPANNLQSIHRQAPPHNVEAEKAVLGAIMLHREVLHQVIPHIKPKDFYLDKHRLIYEAILSLETENEPLDVLTVSDRLKVREQLDKVGKLPYLSELADRIPTTANAGYYAQIIREKSIVRQLITVGTEIVQEAYQEVEDVPTFLDSAEQRIFEIRQEREQKDLTSAREIVSNTFKIIETLYDRKELVTGVPTGFDNFDKMTSGLQPSDLVILAGRPSMGKTSLALNMASNAALQHGRSVAIFSLEMSKEQLMMRVLCSQARVDAGRLRTGQMKDNDIPKLTETASRIAQSHIYIDDGGNASVLEMRSKCRRMKMEIGNLGLIVIDYLQLMKGDNNEKSREQEISNISRGLKGLAKELHVPVLALSQLNRSLERRPDKRPIMSDLRESGAIEQDADVILFVYRDEVYNEDTEDKGIAELIIGKQRNGPIGTVKMRFFNEYTRFDNLYPEEGGY